MNCVKNLSRNYLIKCLVLLHILAPTCAVFTPTVAQAGFGQWCMALPNKIKAAVIVPSVALLGCTLYAAYNRFVVLDAIEEKYLPYNAGSGEVESCFYNWEPGRFAFAKDIANSLTCAEALGKAIARGTLKLKKKQDAQTEPDGMANVVDVHHAIEYLEFRKADILDEIAREDKYIVEDMRVVGKYVSCSPVPQEREVRSLFGRFIDMIAAPTFSEIFAGVASADALGEPYVWDATLDKAMETNCVTGLFHLLTGKANFGKAAFLYWQLTKKRARLLALKELVRNTKVLKKKAIERDEAAKNAPAIEIAKKLFASPTGNGAPK